MTLELSCSGFVCSQFALEKYADGTKGQFGFFLLEINP